MITAQRPIELSLKAMRRCAGPCGKLLRVPVAFLKWPKVWTCPACEYAAKVEAVKRNRKYAALQEKHGWDLDDRFNDGVAEYA